MNENLDKEIDDIVAPIPSKNETRLTIAVVVLGVIIIVIVAFGAGYYWSSGSPQQQSDSTTGQSPTNGAPSNPSAKDLKIKGNRKSKIYHLPGCGSYDRISPDNIEWFKTKEDAEAAGYRMAKNC